MADKIIWSRCCLETGFVCVTDSDTGTQQPRTLAYGIRRTRTRQRARKTWTDDDTIKQGPFRASKRASISVVLWALNGGRLERGIQGIQDTAGLRTRHETGDETEGNSREY